MELQDGDILHVEYPILNNMTDLDLARLYQEVKDSTDLTDIEFKKAVLAKLRESHLAALES